MRTSRARHTTNFDVAFDLLLLLDDNLSLVMVNRPAARLFAGPAIRSAKGFPISLILQSCSIWFKWPCWRKKASRNNSSSRAAITALARRSSHCNKGRPYVGVALQDITELVNLNRARRDLVANISHELRTPITRIRLIIEGLFLEADKPKRKASIQSLKEIAMETDALLWLAQDLLDLSMIESGEAILRLVKTPLAQVVDEAMAQLESQAAMKELSIVSYVPQKV